MSAELTRHQRNHRLCLSSYFTFENLYRDYGQVLCGDGYPFELVEEGFYPRKWLDVINNDNDIMKGLYMMWRVAKFLGWSIHNVGHELIKKYAEDHPGHFEQTYGISSEILWPDIEEIGDQENVLQN